MIIQEQVLSCRGKSSVRRHTANETNLPRILLIVLAAFLRVQAQVPADQLAKPPAGAQAFTVLSTAGTHGKATIWTAGDGSNMSRESILLRGQVCAEVSIDGGEYLVDKHIQRITGRVSGGEFRAQHKCVRKILLLLHQVGTAHHLLAIRCEVGVKDLLVALSRIALGLNRKRLGVAKGRTVQAVDIGPGLLIFQIEEKLVRDNDAVGVSANLV